MILSILFLVLFTSIIVPVPETPIKSIPDVPLSNILPISVSKENPLEDQEDDVST